MSNIASLVPFQKGDDPRRNVTGANKGSRHMTGLLREALEKIADGNSERYDVLLIKRILKMAIIEGNEAMIKLCFAYLDGMPVQGIEHSGKVEIESLTDEQKQSLKALISHDTPSTTESN
jgi:hypothetical protein